MKYALLIIFFLSLNVFAQEEGPRRDAGGWEYNGVFKFSDKLKLPESGDWSFTAIDFLFSAGPRYHRYDPIRKSDGNTISAFTSSSTFVNLAAEYRFYRYISLIASGIWEAQEVERYDGVSIEKNEPYAREIHYGIQINYDPLFVSYEVGEWRLPHFYIGSTDDEYLRRYIDLDVQRLSVGFRRKITETFSLSFSGDIAIANSFTDPVFGKSKAGTLGVNVLLLHSSGFGLRLREEEGKIESDAYSYKTKAFGIMPFVSLL